MKPHVLMVAMPLLSHILPSLHLCNRLISHGLAVTFVHAKQHRKAVLQRAKDGLNNNLLVTDAFRIAELPDSLPEQNNRHQASEIMDAIISTERGVRGLMNDLSTQKPPILCIIADTILAGIQDIANAFNVPKVDLWTCSATVFSIFLHIPRLISEGYIPLGGKPKPEPSKSISCIPGVPSLHARDIPEELFVEDESDTFFQLLVRAFSRVREAYCVLANTFHELERDCVDALMAQRLSFVPIGPLLDLPCQSPINNVVGYGPDKKQEQTTDAKCLQWLGTQLPASVIYVSFGTMVVLPTYTTQEFALGLEASQQPFLWVIRQENPAVSLDDVLPEGFGLRTERRGLVVSWAPQISVLSHPSVGGFLTHCGWNSVLESVYMGVPMLGLPFNIDQPANLKLIAHEWHIGMPLTTQEKSTSMLRVEVEKGVRELMQGAGRGEMEARATQIRGSARKATSVGGSSCTNLEAFVSDMQRRALKILHQ